MAEHGDHAMRRCFPNQGRHRVRHGRCTVGDGGVYGGQVQIMGALPNVRAMSVNDAADVNRGTVNRSVGQGFRRGRQRSFVPQTILFGQRLQHAQIVFASEARQMASLSSRGEKAACKPQDDVSVARTTVTGGVASYEPQMPQDALPCVAFAETRRCQRRCDRMVQAILYDTFRFARLIHADFPNNIWVFSEILMTAMCAMAVPSART